MNEHLDQLKTLTSKLAPSLLDFVVSDSPCRVYLTLSGRLVGVHIYSDHELAIARLMATAGTVLGPHQHENEDEVLGIISGRAIYTLKSVDGEVTTELKRNESIHIPAGVIHSCVYPEVTWQWAVSTPPAPGFPLPSKGQ